MVEGVQQGPVLVVLVGTFFTWRVYLLLANKTSRRASQPNLTCLVYAAYQLLGSCG